MRNRKNFDSLPKSSRIKLGKNDEEKVALCLIEHYNQNLRVSSVEDDKRRGFDYHREDQSLQIKVRHGWPDLIYERYMPWYGFSDPGTRPGRDHNKDYDVYVCLVEKDHKKIIVEVDAKEFKALIKKVDIEFKKWSKTHNIKSRVFKSKTHPGCEYWFHVDKDSHLPKILTYIEPETFPNRIVYEYKS